MKTNEILRILLCVVLIIVSSQLEAKVQIDGIYYDLDISEKTAKVASASPQKYSGEIIIPQTVSYEEEVYTVTAIGSFAFYKSTITSIELPNSIVCFEQFAFLYCQDLASITIPNSVTTIKDNAFSRCI